MGDSSALFEIILFAILAGFLVIKLRGVLGKRTGHEKNAMAIHFLRRLNRIAHQIT